MQKWSLFCRSRSTKILSLLLPHKLFNLKSNLAKKFCPFPNVGKVLLLLTDPSEEWGMAEDHGAPEARQLQRAWTRGHRETSCQRVSSTKSP